MLSRLLLREECRRFWQLMRRHLTEIQTGISRIFLRKCARGLELLIAVPVVLIVRLLRPWVIIRFAVIPSEGIGPFSGGMEVYLCERDAKLHGRRTLEIFSYSIPVCNQQLKMMWQRVIPITQFALAAERVNRWLPGGHANYLPWRGQQARDMYNLLADTTPHLAFTEAEERLGWERFCAFGVSEHTPWVCFHARDPAFYVRRSQYRNRDHDHRNSDIEAQLPAMEMLARRGYVAFRMGARVEKVLRQGHPRIIDYATTARTDFLDIFLCAHCRFYLGDPDGLASVAMTFRRPVAYVNFPAIEYVWTWSRDHLFILKKLWLKTERRLLTFPEAIRSGVGRFMRTHLFEECGIELVDNTAEEITELALEMDERLTGRWLATEEDEELQRRFWTMFTTTSTQHASLLRGGPIRARIGTAFLRHHRELLDERTTPAPLVVTV